MKLTVTDHALVRFLARTGGADIEGLRAALSASLTRAAAAADLLGAHEYRIIADGLEYVVTEGRVVTVLVHGRPR